MRCSSAMSRFAATRANRGNGIAALTLSQGRGTAALAQRHPAMKAGQAIYVDRCSACPPRNGVGAATIFPPLKDSPIVQSTDPTTLIRVVLHGTQNVATPAAPTGPAMPALGWVLSD